MIDLENLIDEIDLVEVRLRDHREDLKELTAQIEQKYKDYYDLKDYYYYLLAKKKTGCNAHPATV